MARRLTNQKGFSLIELMIVVAIIGILATIAVPNFQKMQGRARQSEAKAALAGIYSGQKAFYAEWSAYYSDLRDVGYVAEGVMNYVVGTSGSTAIGIMPNNFMPSTIGVRTGAAGVATNTCINSGAGAECSKGTFSQLAPGVAAAGAQTATFTANTAGTGNCLVTTVSSTAPTTTTFTMSANGYVSSVAKNATKLDVWAIDQDKNMCNTLDGLL